MELDVGYSELSQAGTVSDCNGFEGNEKPWIPVETDLNYSLNRWLTQGPGEEPWRPNSRSAQ